MDAHVTLLGGFAVTIGDVPVPATHWRRRHAAAIVKVLALTPRRVLHREQLIDRIWPDVPVEEAAPRLHKAAHYARRALGAENAIVLAGERVSLLPDLAVDVDAIEFESRGRAALTAGDPIAAGREARRYVGDLLPDEPYEAWADEPRERLRRLYRDLLRLAGRWEALTESDPTDERAHLELVAASARRGDPHGALRQFERLEQALRAELGVAPSRTAQDLRRRIVAQLGGQPGTATNRSATAGSAARSADPSSRPEASRLVGREPIQARLDEILAEVAAGTGRTLLLAGPPGVGKTALAAWVEERARERGMHVGSGVAAQIPGAWPFAPVLEAMAAVCRRHPALLDGLDDALRTEIEAGLTGRMPLSPTVAAGHQRVFVATAELLRLAAGANGAVIVIDDAQEADESSLRLLHYLARGCVTERVLIVLAHRPDPGPVLAQVRQGLLGRGAAVTVDLAPLPRAEVDALIRQHADVSDDAAEAIWIASGGLPFRVVELARAAGAGDRLRAAAPIPPGLSPELREHMVAAAVLGAAFDTDEFLALTGLDDHAGYALLTQALDQLVLVRTDVGFTFRHTLIREALLETVSPGRRRELHRQSARALQALGRSAARIGHHLVEGGDLVGAVPPMLQAARTQASLGAYRDAITTIDSVLPAAAGGDRAALLAIRADMLMAAADAEALPAYRAALAATVDEPARIRLRARLGRAATLAGDLETADVALAGLELTGTPVDAEILMARGHLAMLRGDLATADEAADEARRRVALDEPEEWQMFDLVALQGLVAHSRGEWFERLRHELRIGVRRPAMAARIFDSHLCVAEYLLYGPTPYREVMTLARELRETAERSGVLRAVAFATALRGETAYLMGDLDLAMTELRDAADLHRDIGSTAGESHSLQRLAEAEIESGHRDQAGRHLQRALLLARFSNLSKHLVQRVYGTMIDAAPDPRSARSMVDQAAAAIGLSDQCAFCAIMLAVPSAKACADVGAIEDARRYLAVAERSALRWQGTAWQAAILEVRAHIAVAEGDATAALLQAQAADLFEASGQPLHARRCRAWVVPETSGLSAELR
jgi:DNA-binding SARP family transcriptional activator/tetratricopeptide (TPR) repeat protein